MMTTTQNSQMQPTIDFRRNYRRLKMSALYFITSLILSPLAQADTVTLTVKSGTKKLNDITLAQGATLTTADQKFELVQVSHGLRVKKKFALLPIKVYVAEFFAAQTTKLNNHHDQILNSLKDASPVMLRLTMVRDLTEKQIADSFKEALAINGLKEEDYSPQLKDVFKQIAAIEKFKENDSFGIAVHFTKDNKAQLFLQKPDGTIVTITGDDTFAIQLFKIWFGNPVDDLLGELKKELLKF